MQYEKHKFMRTGRLSCKLLSVSELITEVKVILITNKWVKAIRYYFSLLKRQLPVHYLYTPYGTLSSLLTIYLFVSGSHPLSSFIKALIASSLSSIISVRSCNVSLSFSSHTNVSPVLLSPGKFSSQSQGGYHGARFWCFSRWRYCAKLLVGLFMVL